MASPGIYAAKRAAAQTAQPRMKAVALSGSASINKQSAALSGGVNISGVMGIAALLAGVWALDRYVVDVPFIKATGA